MAAKKKSKKSKKAKSQVKGKKAAPKKTKAKAKPAKKTKPAKKKIVVKKKPAAKPAAAKSRATTKPAAPKPTPSAPAAPAALPGEERIGIVTHYFNHLSVAIVQLETGVLRTGDTVHIKGHTTDFRLTIGSMEVDHVHVEEARAGQSFGLRVSEHAREHDVVYRAAKP